MSERKHKWFLVIPVRSLKLSSVNDQSFLRFYIHSTRHELHGFKYFVTGMRKLIYLLTNSLNSLDK